MKLLLLTILLVALAVVLLGVKVFFVKGGKFPSGHVHDVMKSRENHKKTNKSIKITPYKK